ncbi:unnamed protein product [Brassica napus]|uniref:(rape) hypothetical protein n=1 Tax=Brassica napus TaxID=3708 RepID=A0A816SDL4_BRANA|nr:unnamed protein product [Brassica napus]
MTMSSAGSTHERVLGLKRRVVTRLRFTDRTRVKLNRVFFPADSAKPVPWLWFRWIVDRDIGFPLSVPVLSWLFDARGKLPKEPFPVRPLADTRRSALATLAAQAARQQSTGLELGPRAQPSEPIPFPVTDPFCRLPLPTLFHRPEAVHLGDLMRAAGNAPDTTRRAVLFQPLDPTSRLSRFQGFAATTAPSYSPRPGSCPDGGYKVALQRHPFLGLVDSADERFARQYRCGPPPEFPLAAPLRHSSPSFGSRQACSPRTLLGRSRSVGCAPVRISQSASLRLTGLLTR